jgi:hypothetical protein
MMAAADHVRVAPEHHGADERGGQHRAVQHGQVRRAQTPVFGDQRRGDPDDEQVVGVGEEAHTGGQHRPHVSPANRRLIQRRNQVSGLDILHRITPQIHSGHIATAGRSARSCGGTYRAWATLSRPERERKMNET